MTGTKTVTVKLTVKFGGAYVSISDFSSGVIAGVPPAAIWREVSGSTQCTLIGPVMMMTLNL